MHTIHVINLDRDTQKMKTFSEQCKNVNYRRFRALEGTENDNRDILNVHFLSRMLFCTNSVIGCAQSHMTLWKELDSDKHQDYYIIMEDDACFDETLLSPVLFEIDEYLKQWTNTCTIFSLSCIGPFSGVGNKIKIKSFEYIESVFPLSTTAYVINKAAAKFLLQTLNDTVYYHIDFCIASCRLFFNDCLKYYVITPNVVTTDKQSITSIGSHHKYSLFCGWCKDFMWYCNIPVWKYTSLYSLILIVVILFLTVMLYLIKSKHEKYKYYIGVAILVLCFEFTLFLMT